MRLIIFIGLLIAICNCGLGAISGLIFLWVLYNILKAR